MCDQSPQLKVPRSNCQRNPHHMSLVFTSTKPPAVGTSTAVAGPDVRTMSCRIRLTYRFCSIARKSSARLSAEDGQRFSSQSARCVCVCESVSDAHTPTTWRQTLGLSSISHVRHVGCHTSATVCQTTTLTATTAHQTEWPTSNAVQMEMRFDGAGDGRAI